MIKINIHMINICQSRSICQWKKIAYDEHRWLLRFRFIVVTPDFALILWSWGSQAHRLPISQQYLVELWCDNIHLYYLLMPLIFHLMSFSLFLADKSFEFQHPSGELTPDWLVLFPFQSKDQRSPAPQLESIAFLSNSISVHDYAGKNHFLDYIVSLG